MTADPDNRIRKEAEENREPGKDIESLLYQRWSPRSLGRDMDEDDLETLFEAARWAPSSYNNQSWRFLYATHGDEHWEDFVSLMNDFNAGWAENGYALIVLVSKKTFDHNGEDSITHSFDTGAAWQNLALEATRQGLAAHGMQGFDYEEAREKLDIPEGYEVEAMIAVGSYEGEETIDEDLQVEPNGRKDLDEIRAKGRFGFE